MPTTIEWCHPPGYKGETWNPVTGCSPVSEGCKNCYAQRMAHRLRGRAGYAADQPFRVRVHPVRLKEPSRWRKPRFCFVCSMGDLFHSDVPGGRIMDVWRLMGRDWQHVFVVLTKRADRMQGWMARWADNLDADPAPKLARGPRAVREAHTCGRALLFADMIEGWGEPPEGAAYPAYDWMDGMRTWPTALPNVWLGVSCENQRWADERIPALLRIPAAVRLVSLEPLLGPVDLRNCVTSTLGDGNDEMLDALNGLSWNRMSCVSNPHFPRPGRGLNWPIVGGETGPGARLCRVEWIRQVVQDCRAAGVPCFVKQLGSNSDHPGVTGRGADMAQWPRDLWVREFPTAVHHGDNDVCDT